MSVNKLDYNGLCTLVDNIKAYALRLYRLYNSDPLTSNPLAYYRYLMNEFFKSKGSATATPAQLTAICDKWYMESRGNWFGWTRFYNPELSAVSEGVKGGDNYGMVCEPSTNTYRGQDDYSTNPLFIPTDCNWEMTDNGEPLITSIEGIDCLVPFERNNPNKFVGVLQMTGYHWWNTPDKSKSSYLYEGYSSLKINTSDIANIISDSSDINIAPLPEAVINENVDVTSRVLLESTIYNSHVRSWVCHSKYETNLTSSNTLTSYSGGRCSSGSISHVTSHTYANNTSTAHSQSYTYSAHTACDASFLILMYRIKYASLAFKDHLTGCQSYHFSYAAAVAESSVSRFIVTATQAENILIGSTVRIGTGSSKGLTTNVDAYSISGADGYIVTGKIPVGDNVAIVVDNGTRSFTTTTSTYIHSHIWRTGMTDEILGNDGSPTNPIGFKEPAKLQGIEYMNGTFQIFSDVLCNLVSAGTITPYFVRRVSQQASSITSDYISSNCVHVQTGGSGMYEALMYFNGGNSGLYFPYRPSGTGALPVTVPDASATTYTKSVMNSEGTDINGVKDFQTYVGGIFMYPSEQGGPCYCSCWDDVDKASYHISTRLSCNGNRGNYV